MANETTRTSVGDSVPTEFIAEVRLKSQEGGVMRNAVFHDELPPGEGNVYTTTELVRVAASALTEGTDLSSNTELTDTEVNITPAEIGAMVFLTDLARDQITKRANLFRLAGQILGNSIITKEDVDLLTLLDGFSVALGSAGTALTAGHVLAAAAAVRAGGQAAGAITAGTPEPGPDPIYGVFNDNMFHNVIKNLGGLSLTTSGVLGPRSALGDQVLQRAAIGTLGGATILMDNNIGKDSSDDAKGGVFSMMALQHVSFMGGPRIEPERNASLRGTELVVTYIKGEGEWKDNWGREMLFDAAAPTS